MIDRDKKLSDEDLVFSAISEIGLKPLRPLTISRAWYVIARHAGVKAIRFHDARHTHASLMLKQGVHAKIVQERLGQSTISTTLDIYSHVTPGMQAAAAAKFDDMLNVGYNDKAVVTNID